MAMGIDNEFRHNYPVGTYFPQCETSDLTFNLKQKTKNVFIKMKTKIDGLYYDNLNKSVLCLFKCNNLEVEGMDVLPADGNYRYFNIGTSGDEIPFWWFCYKSTTNIITNTRR